MLLRLYDNTKLRLDDSIKTHKERWNLLNQYIFENENYEAIYNVCSDKLTNFQSSDIAKRWIGIKKVGRDYRDEHLKGFLNACTSYYLNCKQYSVKNTNSIKIKRGIIVFIKNKEYEKLLESRLKELKDSGKTDYTTKFMISNIDLRIKECKECIRKAKFLKNKINKLHKDIKYLKSEIGFCYTNLDNMDAVINLARKLKEKKDEIKHCYAEIGILNDKYFVNTEYIYRTK